MIETLFLAGLFGCVGLSCAVQFWGNASSFRGHVPSRTKAQDVRETRAQTKKGS